MGKPELIRFRLLESLFDQAIEVPDKETRERFLASACEDDPSLLVEVSSLLHLFSDPTKPPA